MYAIESSLLPAIFLIPLAGALFNGLFGRRLGKGISGFVAVAAPVAAFVITLAVFCAMHIADHGPLLGPPSTALVLKPRAGASVSQGGRALVAASHKLESRIGLAVAFDGKGASQVLRLNGPASLASDPTLQEIAREQSLTIGKAADLAPRSFKYNFGSWISVGNFKVDFEFIVDRLNIILMLVITGVGSLIHLYSVDYMGHEPRGTFARFFTYLNLFVAAMLTLVMGGNLLLLFIGWEGVGMCSYLLIGFEYEDPDKAACGTKAFVVNRIGDLGVVLGMFCLLGALGSTGASQLSLDFSVLNGALGAGTAQAGLVGAGCLLLFFGCTGKSAQIPLHLWLPDAMAGPTPVSALIHAATMVTAGIYLIARLSPVFAGAEVLGAPVLGLVAVVGGLTAFFAGAAAIGQDDIKKVLAYSTVSQLGYMFLGVGALAMGAAVFHLVTHAFFKAVLFLGAGAVIHATHTQSMRRMGGLRHYMPTAYWTMTAGALALAGFPFLSGFFSKDMILFSLLLRAQSEGAVQWIWWALYGLGVGTGLLTAVYSTRLIGMTFWGDYRGGGPGGRNPHPSPRNMALPLAILGGLAVIGGLLGLPALAEWMHGGAELLPHYLAPVVAQPAATLIKYPAPDSHTFHSLELFGLGVGAAAALVGVGVGWKIWGSTPPAKISWESQVTGTQAQVRKLLAHAWYYDEVLNKRFVQPAIKYLSGLLWEHVDDAAIDRGLVDGTGRVAVQLSLFTRATQTGQVARYAAYFVVGAVVILAGAHLFSLSH